jgi:hypothetical protein
MSRREAEQFEIALQEVAQGRSIDRRFAPLVQTAWRATALAEPPPPPPNRLLPGRRRILVEAARRQAERARRRKGRVRMTAAKLAAASLVAVLVLGLVFGTAQAAAGSLPGEPLYGLKLTTERARLALTTAPQSRARLRLELSQKRLDEVTALLEQGEAIDESHAQRVQMQLTAALEAAVQMGGQEAVQALHRLETAIQQHQQTMAAAMVGVPEPAQMRMQQILRAMERVRQEALNGQGDPGGLRQRMRHGTPPELMNLPEPSPTPQPQPGPGQGGTDAGTPPGAAPASRPTLSPPTPGADEPTGSAPMTDPADADPQADHEPGDGGSQPEQPSGGSGSGSPAGPGGEGPQGPPSGNGTGEGGKGSKP